MRTSFDFILTPAQFARAVEHNNRRLIRNSPMLWLVSLCSVSLWAALSFALLYSLNVMGDQSWRTVRPLLAAAAVIAGSFVLYRVLSARGVDQLFRKVNHLAGVPRTLRVEATGLRDIGPHSDSLISWSGIIGVEEIDDAILLIIDDVTFHPIAASAFESAAEKDEFIGHVRARTAGTVTSAAAAPAAGADVSARDVPHSPEVVQARPAASLLILRGSFAYALRSALFMRVPEHRIVVGWWQVPVFALAGLVVYLLWSFFHVGPGGQFQWYSLPSALVHIPLLLLAGIWTAHLLGQPRQSLLLVQVFLMTALAVDLLFVGLGALIGGFGYARPFARALGPALLYLPALWMAAACAVSAVRLLSPQAPRGLLAFGVCALLIALPLSFIYRDHSLWETPYDPDRSSRSAGVTPASEAAFYSQARILERELGAVQPGRKGVIDVFFIGVAGYAGQDVFMKEVNSVAELFRSRFGSQGRTVRLINNSKAIADAPVASKTGLRAALARVAEVMDKDEDILFLFLTSHGSETHQFSLEFGPMQFDEIDPVGLRALLDEAGIKHRVVVISACYSGGFINALSDDNTLAISASAPDRNSFGCTNEAEWTYFGKAYFDEALRQTYSFSEAFKLALPVIAARERKEEFKPSNPQLAEGASIRAKLAELERQLLGRGDQALPAAAPDKRAIRRRVDRYVALLYSDDALKFNHDECIEEFRSTGPAAALERDPNAYGGMNQQSAQWPRLVLAWDRYAEEYCRTTAPAVMRSKFTKNVEALISDQELEPVLRFLDTDAGKVWLARSLAIDKASFRDLAALRREANATAIARLQDEQRVIYEAFEKERSAREKRR